MLLVLNELSYSFDWNEGKANALYDNFFNVCSSFEKEAKRKINLRYAKNKNNEDVIFRNDAIFLKWLSQQEKDYKLSILSTLTGGQFIIDYPYYKVFQEEGKGIGYSYENDELLLSFQSDDKWKTCELNVTQELLNEETGKIDSEEYKVKNCYNEDSKKCHTGFIKSKLQFYNDAALIKIKNEVLRGDLLWRERVILFPNLIFCSSTEEYIKNIQSGDVLQNLLGRLYEYELYFKGWSEGDFEISKVKGNARLESDTRKNKISELLVNCPDGEKRIFTFHCNYGFSDLRLHFFPNTVTRKCFIGYIGKKLV